jgi:hypothetical protein
MGNSVLEFESVGGHGCNRDAKVGEEVFGCNKMGCPDCEARAFVTRAILGSPAVGSFVRARFVHWPGTATEVVDEFTLVPTHEGSFVNRVKVTRRKRDFLGNVEPAP